ncbi:MAG: hypothetical protein U1F64_05190 [Burkholderiales bacterium]
MRFVVVAAAAMLAVPALAAEPVTRVPGAQYRPATVQKALVPVPMRVETSAASRRVELAVPTASERAKLVELNRNAGSARAAPGRPQFIGFGREVALADRRLDLAKLAWTTLEGGDRAARIEIASAGAASVRVALRFAQSTPGLTFRFASASAARAMDAVSASTIAQATARFGEYWSPVIEGTRAAVEVEAKAGTPLDGLVLEIARVSHLVASPTASAADELKLLQDIGRSGSCNINVKCVQPQDDALLHQAAATGKLVFTVPSGATARCTGTMINDSANSFTPYLFGANHCFETAYEAFTLNVWWFFDAQSCDSPTTPGSYIEQTGGAMLLGRSQDWDWALLRLNTMPPAGVFYSGWDTATLGSGVSVEIYHHPSGDLKKWSLGTTFGNVPVDFAGPAGGPGAFTRVVYTDGTTEGGSSGGGLVTFDGSNYWLRGGLLGGDALCSNPNGSDYYSQIGVMMPLVRQYLTPTSQVPGLVVSVEFYHANLDHYFMTSAPADIAALDSGQIVGWERTGFRFLAYDAPGPGRSPVCRFYRKPQFGDSHFYSADPFECARVAVDYAAEWVYESPAIYYVALPDVATGACPADTKPVYRFLNLFEINHRYTTEVTVAQALSATPGWIPEGYGPGPLYPVMCSPNGS